MPRDLGFDYYGVAAFSREALAAFDDEVRMLVDELDAHIAEDSFANLPDYGLVVHIYEVEADQEVQEAFAGLVADYNRAMSSKPEMQGAFGQAPY